MTIEPVAWKNKDGTVTYKRRSPISGEWSFMSLNTSLEKITQWVEWNRSADAPLIQDYFSELNHSEREFVLTGIHPEEWDEIVGDQNETE